MTNATTCNIILTCEIILKKECQIINDGFDLSIVSVVMPILIAAIILVIAVLIIMVFYKTKKAQSVNMIAFEELAQELKADNKFLKSELEAMKGTLNSINKMMKEIE